MKNLKMLLCCAVCAALSASCSEQAGDSLSQTEGSKPIDIEAGIGDGSQTAALKFPAMESALTISAYRGNDTSFTPGEAYFTADMSSSADGSLSWADGKPRYFPVGANSTLWFFAWSPAQAVDSAADDAEEEAEPTATFQLSGVNDIMWAAASSAPTGDAVPVQFEHKLMQVSFKVQCDENYHLGDRVTGIEIVDQPATATLNTYSGDLSFGEELRLYGQSCLSDAPISTAASDVLLSFMLEPQTSFAVNVSTRYHAINNVPVVIGEEDAVAGNNIEITLYFHAETAEVKTYTVEDWQTASTSFTL